MVGSGSNTFRKIFIMMWKNLLLRKRHYIQTALEIILPTLLFVILVAIHSTGDTPNTQEGTNVVPANIPRVSYYPVDYCLSLTDMLEKETDEDDKTSEHLTVLARQIYYTNVPSGQDKGAIEPSLLAKDIMETVQKTINYFLLPCCTLINQAENTNVTLKITENGILKFDENQTQSTDFSEDDIVEKSKIAQLGQFNDISNGNTSTLFYGGIIFPPEFNYDNETTRSCTSEKCTNMNYTIRFGVNYVQYETDSMYSTGAGPSSSGSRYKHFAKFQNLIDLAYIQLTSNKEVWPLYKTTENPEDDANFNNASLQCLKRIPSAVGKDVWVTATQEMPYPEYKSEDLAFFIGFISMFMILSFAIIIPPLIKRIVHEKESGIKELLKIMGLPNWINWLTWYLDAFMATTISVALMIILLCIEWSAGYGKIIQDSDPFMMFIFFLLYGVALIFFCFALSTFFTSPNLALTAGIVLHLLTYFLPSVIIANKKYMTMSIGNKMGLALMPNACIQQALKILQSLEGTGGLQWNNLWTRIEPDDPQTMGLYWLMFLVDITIYALIMWYVDTIKPGTYGVGRKWYFPFELCIPKTNTVDNYDSERRASAKRKINQTLFEDDPSGNPSIEVQNLRKVFKSLSGDDLVAVNDVTFRAFGGQIMALLGHNGAGKSTTFNILTGMYSKTGGDTKINGYDTDNSMDIVRKSLGICPQHNMLFPELTVGEHFTMFGMIKGLSKTEATVQGKEYIKRLNLEKKHNVITDKLSGGMKRKVNLGISLIGDSSVVMLDEPTSGMDPQARRYTWDLLQTEKKKRTILLTTHFMEEADILGDRIAIMARGQIQCYGTSLFLKRKLGEGYSLSMSLGGNSDEGQISDVVKKIIPAAEVKSNASGELIFSLPAAESKSFGDLFEALEREKVDLDIGNFGLSITTMEDVFLKVGSMAEDRYQVQRRQSHMELQRRKSMKSLRRGNSNQNIIEAQTFDINEDSKDMLTDQKAGGQEKLKGLSLLQSRITGLMMKRIICTKRRWVLFLLIGLIPMLQALFSQLIINFYSNFEANFESKVMQFSDYEDPISVYPLNVSQDLNGIFEKYGKLVELGSTTRQYDNISEGLLNVGKENLLDYRKNYIIGGNFEPLGLLDDLSIPNIPFLPSPNSINVITGLYNSIPKHSRPLSTNYISNALLQHLDGSEERRITTSNHPLPFTFTAPSDLVSDGFISPYIFTYGSLLSIAMSLLVSVFLIFPLVERTSGAKHLQMMTGLHPVTFWITNLAWDFSIYLASSALMIIFLMAFDYDKTFTSAQAPGATILITLFHGIPAILMAYLFSFWAKTPASGFSVMTILGVISGLIATTAVWITLGFKSWTNPIVEPIGYAIKYVFMFIPTFNFGRAIMAIAQIQLENNVCSSGIDVQTVKKFCSMFNSNPITIFNNLQSSAYLSCCTAEFMAPEPEVCGKTIQDFPEIPIKELSPDQIEQINDALKCFEIKQLFVWDEMEGVNYDLVFFVMNTLIFGILLILLEKKVFRSLSNNCKSSPTATNSGTNNDLDDDVDAEVQRVLENKSNFKQDDLLTVCNLQKNFGKFKAVQGLSFGVHYGECFGFLGINGAGKTTSFKMLTGDEQLTAGEATLNGYKLGHETEKFLSEIGYCPQFDAIIDHMTGKEMLVLFCRLRGILPKNIEKESQKWIQFLGLDEYADRKCGTYSGGNKRKLSIGMALVADPPIIFFDEPSTGVDPVARRKLWNVISTIQQRGQSVVLTSHSMEECEALCDRLAIMVNGQFQCFGNIPHLKNKFGQGFTVLVKLEKGAGENESELSRVRDALLTRLSDAVIQDEHKEYIHVHVRDVNMLWSSMFKIMEDIRDEFPAVEDYSISETSLEQVFISFAKNQKSNEDQGKKKKKSKKDEEANEVGMVPQPKLVRHLSTVSRVSSQDNTHL